MTHLYGKCIIKRYIIYLVCSSTCPVNNFTNFIKVVYGENAFWDVREFLTTIPRVAHCAKIVRKAERLSTTFMVACHPLRDTTITSSQPGQLFPFFMLTRANCLLVSLKCSEEENELAYLLNVEVLLSFTVKQIRIMH